MNILSIGQAARVLGLSTVRVRQLIEAGKLPSWRNEFGWRLVDRRAVEHLVRERRRLRGDAGGPAGAHSRADAITHTGKHAASSPGDPKSPHR